MKRRKEMPESGRDTILLAVNGDRDLLATATIFEQMNVSLRIVADMAELERTLTGDGKPAGAIISHAFLNTQSCANLERIKRLAPELRIVIAASQTNAAFERAVREIGIFYYLLSPYDREEYLSVIRALCSEQSKEKREKQRVNIQRTGEGNLRAASE